MAEGLPPSAVSFKREGVITYRSDREHPKDIVAGSRGYDSADPLIRPACTYPIVSCGVWTYVQNKTDSLALQFAGGVFPGNLAPDSTLLALLCPPSDRNPTAFRVSRNPGPWD